MKMNNLIFNPKTLARLWAALYCDFEDVIVRFMGGQGWRYTDFAKVCRETQITLVMHTTQGRGKTKDEHYMRITDMIFQLCKDLWLKPSELKPPVSSASPNESLAIKRALGGFYMLYTMYEKQPIADRTKISLGLDDMARIATFHEAIKGMDVYPEVAFMIQYLQIKESFYFCVFSDELRFDASSRNFLNMSQSKVVTMTKKMQEAQDVLAYSPVHHQCQESFKALSLSKNDMKKNLIKTIDPETLEKHMSYMSLFRMFMRTVCNDNFQKAMGKLDKLLVEPILTLQSLTATEATERRLMGETRLRMDRARKRTGPGVIEQDPDKLSRPYVREGGIFGRKKDCEEEAERMKRRERGACTGNLWIYIYERDFAKPEMARDDDLEDCDQADNEDEDYEDEMELDELDVDVE